MMFQRVRTLQEGSSNVVKTHFYTDGSFSCVPSKWYQKFNINQSFTQDILAECTAGFKNRLFLRLLRVISLSWNI